VGITNSRHQHSVGQGCFHSGAVNEGSGSELTYIYDCGAMTLYRKAREREVRGYLKLRGRNSTLGILFLSHVHADHVNGVTQLLKDKKRLKVDTIMMPLINVAERLMAFARTASVDASSASEPFYRDFIVDPVAACVANFAPRQIIMVRRGGSGGAPGSGPGDDLAPPDGPPIMGLETEKGLSWKLVGTGSVRAINPKDTSGSVGSTQYEVPDTTAVKVVAAAGGEWLLAPFVDPMVRKSRKAFLDELAVQCSVPKPRIRAWLKVTSNVERLVTVDRKKLVAAYARVAKDFNVTSMCLYSGPARDTASGLRRGRFGNFGRISASGERPGWLGTGDAALKDPKRRNAMLRHYGRLLREVGTLLLPHHGSDHNFHANLLKRIRPEICVASADDYSNWKHPGPHTVHTICSQPAVIHVVTSAAESVALEIALLG
jgi:glyoxylase-like metal-dependent hydrolase (beta-lactamase superfamily II)